MEPVELKNMRKCQKKKTMKNGKTQNTCEFERFKRT